jgi:hypothetical protein
MPQINWCRLGECGLREAKNFCTALCEFVLEVIEKNIAAWFRDIEQANDVAINGGGSRQQLACCRP